MFRRIVAALLVCMLLAGNTLAEEGRPLPYTGDLIGTWVFCGGAEEHGDGFRLHADGTGVVLEIIDYDQVPLQYQDTDNTFTWRVEYTADKTCLHETYNSGRSYTYEIEDYGDRIHIPNEWSGGFYTRSQAETAAVPEDIGSMDANQPDETPRDESPTVPELTARLGVFPKNQRYEVYEAIVGGDDTPNRRAGNGKAVVSTNGDIWVYATWKGMLLIEYEISSSRHRVGWIDAGQLPAYTLEGVPELPWDQDTEQNVYGVVTSFTSLIEDPRLSYYPVCLILSGTSVRVLAKYDRFYLVEGFVDEELRMGFIPDTALSFKRGYSAEAKRTIGYNTIYTEADVASAFDALSRFIEDAWPGTGLAAVRYNENEANEAYSGNPWWTDDTGAREGILLLADLSSMELYHFEIGGAFARDYIFILYRDPGGAWEVCNWGYT